MNRLDDYDLGLEMGAKGGVLLCVLFFAFIWAVFGIYWYTFVVMLIITAIDLLWNLYRNIDTIHAIRHQPQEKPKGKPEWGYEYDR